MARFKTLSTPTADGFTPWQKPEMQGYRLGCCDCGLVHEVEFAVIEITKNHPDGTFSFDEISDPKYRVQFRCRRHERSTAAIRREDAKRPRCPSCDARRPHPVKIKDLPGKRWQCSNPKCACIWKDKDPKKRP